MVVRSSHNASPSQQLGAALLIFMLVLILAGMAVLFGVLDNSNLKLERSKKTGVALFEAKKALIGWSVSQANMGRLPCPEDTTLIGMPFEGNAKATCTLPAVGRLPWRTLGLGDIRDGNGNKLWYVISAGFRTPPININTPAQLNVDGAAAAAVALVISPGEAIGAQTRPAVTNVSPPSVTDYLELTNNDGDNTFVTIGAPAVFNDGVTLVKHSELFAAVTNRVLGEVKGDGAQGLIKFYADYTSYAYADTNADGNADNLATIGSPSYNGGATSLFFSPALKSVLVSNGWFPLMAYQVAANQQSAILSLNGQTITVP